MSHAPAYAGAFLQERSKLRPERRLSHAARLLRIQGRKSL